MRHLLHECNGSVQPMSLEAGVGLPRPKPYLDRRRVGRRRSCDLHVAYRTRPISPIRRAAGGVVGGDSKVLTAHSPGGRLEVADRESRLIGAPLPRLGGPDVGGLADARHVVGDLAPSLGRHALPTGALERGEALAAGVAEAGSDLDLYGPQDMIGRPTSFRELATRLELSEAIVSRGIRRDDADFWAKALAPITSRPAPGRVTVQLTRDPFVLSLTSDRHGIRVADPVQLCLDCRAAGERALEAADAIRAEMHW